MKTIRLHNIFLFCFCLFFMGCSDWLDVKPVDKTLEEEQFSTEAGILSVLTGFYREMASQTLYGGNLSQTAIEAMANRIYYYAPNASEYTESTLVKSLSESNFETVESKNLFTNIWKTSYKLCFRINNYMKALENSSAPISVEKKNLMMGEGYGLRAYLHFDLFRLYGPAYSDETKSKKYIPYNDLVPTNQNFEEDLIKYGNQTAENFIKKLLDDVKMAKELLEETDLIKSNFDEAVTATLSENNYHNRNRRMNYYAVCALEARILQYVGRLEEAAKVAEEVYNVPGFAWVGTDYNSKSNYTMFSEVIFGIGNINQKIDGEKFYMNTTAAKGYFTSDIILNYLYRLSGDMRKASWKERNGGINVDNTRKGYFNFRYVSMGYADAVYEAPAGNYFQPLIRKSEMLYIMAENYMEKGKTNEAVELLNELLSARNIDESYRLGKDNNSVDIEDMDELYKYLLEEYYREFSCEGQAFFFSKRHQLEYRFNAAATTEDKIYEDYTIDLDKAYVIPIPTGETNI